MTLNKNSVEAYLNFTSSITYGETVSLLWAGEGDKCESYRFRTNTDAFERIYASRPAPLARFRRWPSEKKIQLRRSRKHRGRRTSRNGPQGCGSLTVLPLPLSAVAHT